MCVPASMPTGNVEVLAMGCDRSSPKFQIAIDVLPPTSRIFKAFDEI